MVRHIRPDHSIRTGAVEVPVREQPPSSSNDRSEQSYRFVRSAGIVKKDEKSEA